VKLQQAFEAFPTFLDQSRATAVRVTQFAKNTNPLITQLRPAARELSPTLVQLHAIAPDLRSLFKNLGPLIDSSEKGAPAIEHILNNTRPLLAQLDPFLRNLNPMLDYLGLYKHEIVSFFALDAASAQAVDRPTGATAPVHYLRTSNPLNAENLAAYPRRLATNRSNPYPAPLEYNHHPMRVFGTYLCGTEALPTLNNNPPPTGTLIPPNLGSIVQLPPAVSQVLPPTLQQLVQTYALGSGAAPPCVEQPPNGRLVGQTGKYAQVKAAPEK
jgi:ABC-type transporter Mla subunit MlaD